MQLVKLLPEVTMTVMGTSTTQYQYFWFTGFMSCIAMDAVLSSVKITNIAGGCQITPFVQFAAVRPDAPSAPAGIPAVTPTNWTTNGEKIVTVANYAMASAANGNTYVRFGVGVLVTAAGTGVADVTFQLSYLQLGKLLPPWSGHLSATSTTAIITPITGWMSALNISAVEAAIVMGDRGNSYAVDLVYRTAAASEETPDAWSSGVLAAAIAANGETNSTERAISPGSKMLIQFGLSSVITSGNPGQADLMVLLGIRQAT